MQPLPPQGLPPERQPVQPLLLVQFLRPSSPPLDPQPLQWVPLPPPLEQIPSPPAKGQHPLPAPGFPQPPPPLVWEHQTLSPLQLPVLQCASPRLVQPLPLNQLPPQPQPMEPPLLVQLPLPSPPMEPQSLQWVPLPPSQEQIPSPAAKGQLLPLQLPPLRSQQLQPPPPRVQEQQSPTQSQLQVLHCASRPPS